MAKKKRKDLPKQSNVKDLVLTLQDLVSVRQAFIQLQGMKLKGGAGARRIGKLLSILKIEYDDYDKQTQALIQEHGEKKPEGLGHYINPKNDEQVKKFGDEHRELLEDTVDLRFRPISMSDFGEIEFPMQIMSDLHMFFDFEDDEIEPKPEEELKSEEESEDEDESEDEEESEESESAE